MSSVKVAVRVRPFNNREILNKAECIIKMDGNTTGKNSCIKVLKGYYIAFLGIDLEKSIQFLGSIF